ncbi:MAG TPA: tetratricopeptide repeat protein [Candidatus Sulfotelmatobacter sp.]|nr:tetratricopeptide repeat protein [Candidatus Sulfotelmatobacter sp.]
MQAPGSRAQRQTADHNLGAQDLAHAPGKHMGEPNESSRLKSAGVRPEGSSLPQQRNVSEAVTTPPPETIPFHPVLGSDQAFDSEAATVLELPNASEAPTSFGAPLPPRPSPPNRTGQSTNQAWAADRLLQVGAVLGSRYEILQLLGEGGMGAVYKARDQELDRIIALKVIRPELASHPEILQRFKQELVLARQVTDRNIIRIFDLGEAEGIRFITMEYVEGTSLHHMLRERGKIPPEEAAEIVRQVLQGLRAAHDEGVIHRDLKPGNIMRDAQGRILVMDFGLARSMGSDGMTKTGAVLGTMEYMSPEQAAGTEADQRSDLFTVGLIFFEILTGTIPYKADSALASLWKRLQERAIPVSHLDSSIPAPIVDIVSKCLERDPAQRYQSADEVLRDVENWQSGRAAATLGFHADVKPWGQTIPWHWVGGIVALMAMVVAGFLLRGKLFGPNSSGQSGAAISLAIVPFRNASGDPSLDWVGTYLAETLGSDVGQSSSLRTVSSDHIRQLLQDLRLTPSSSLDGATVQRLAASSDAQVVVWGQYAKFGDQIRIDASVQDLKQDRITPLKLDAANQSALPVTVDHLAQAIRQNLSLSAAALKELQQQAFQPSSKSLPALRDYNDGLALMRRWDYLEARKRFENATTEDPQFALAYARLGQSDSVLGYDNDAESASRKAVELSQSLPVPEKYRIETIHAWTMRNYPKAIENYESLAKVSSDDSEIQSALGLLYLSTGAYDKARADYSKMLERDPKSTETLFGIGRVELESGNPQSGLDYLNRALGLAIQSGNDEEKALILHVIGIGYRRLDKPDEALRNFQEALVINRRLGENGAIARSLNEIGQIMDRLGKSDDALKNHQEALKLRREIGDKQGIGDTLIDLGNLYNERGQYAQAMQMYKESLQSKRDLGDEHSQALDLNNIGNVYFAEADYQAALTFYQQSLQLREKLKVPADIAETVHNLGDTAVRMGQFDAALTDYLRALELYRSADDKRDSAIESHSTADVFRYQGRYSAALKSEDEALKVFRQLQDHGSWLGDVLSGYGNSLTLLGRGDEARPILNEARDVARDIKSDPLAAEALNFEGDRLFYAGDLKLAKSLYEDALRTASRTTDREKTLVAKLNLAKVAVAQKNSREAIKSLKGLAAQADTLGLKYFSLECSVSLAQALLDAKNYSAAKQELQEALDKSDKLGARVLLAKSHFLLAEALRLTGNGSEAAGQYKEAARLLDEIHNEPGADKVLERADLKPIYQESTRWSQIAKN